MAVAIRAQTYHDPVGRANRRRRLMRRGCLALGALILAGGLAWVLLFSSLFAVTDIRVSGAAGVGDARVADTIGRLLGRRHLYVFQPARNMLLLDAGAVASHVMDTYAAIERVAVAKQYPHALAVTVTERQPLGIWCRRAGGGDDWTCRYVDRSGARWGQALPSSGTLLLLVKDERTDDILNAAFLSGILAALDGLAPLGLHARSVTLPDAEPGGITIATDKGYDLYLDALGDVADQFAVLGVFLADRAKDPAFAPQYLDVRTPGRVYYK